MERDRLNAILSELARKYARFAEEILGENLVSVALFGSVARGEAKETSDIDLLVVCHELPQGMFKRRALLEPVRERLQEDLEALWQQGIYADFTELVYTTEEAKRFHWVYLEMLEDAVLLFDRGDFLRKIFDNLRMRLQQLGARRRQLGKIRYFDLKPDLKPGEVFEL